MPAKTLSDRIKLAMARRGIATPSALARKMKINRQTVHRWYNGEGTNPEPEMLVKLARALDVNIYWLILGSDEPMENPGPPSPEDNEVFAIYQSLANHPRALKSWISHGHDILELAGPRHGSNKTTSKQS